MESYQARVRFNLSTGEFELQGSEAFVEMYFARIQSLLESLSESAEEEKKPPERKKQKRRPGRRKETSERRSARRDTHTETLMNIMREAGTGLNTRELAQQSGLSERQVRTIIYRAEKRGLIRKLRRGVYTLPPES